MLSTRCRATLLHCKAAETKRAICKVRDHSSERSDSTSNVGTAITQPYNKLALRVVERGWRG